MKKQLLSLLTLLAVSCSGAPSSPSGVSSAPSCEHDYHLHEKVDPTEKEDGKNTYKCSLCGDTKDETIPKLTDQDYQVTNIEATCTHGSGKEYASEQYGTYLVTDDDKLPHDVYGGECSMCGQLIGEFDFKNLSNQVCPGYPRLYRLSEYWDNAWLLGGDDGMIRVRKSYDEGEYWESMVTASFRSGYACANVDFFELPNHDIICSYRAIGNSGNTIVQYNRKLCFSISHDGGDTWEDGGDIVDNYVVGEASGLSQDQVMSLMRSEGRLGFFEPYVELINNVPTVVYADDFTPAATKAISDYVSYNYKTQYLMTQEFDVETMKFSSTRKIIMDGTQKKAVGPLKARYSRDGMPVIAPYKGGYVMVFEGTYRDQDYQSLTYETPDFEKHPFEILLSYSEDGIHWSNPNEIYIPHGNGSKASAPFVCVTSDNRLVVSFQTDEDAVPKGYVGDAYSMMKVIVSKPGIEPKDMNEDSFYGLCNVNNTMVPGSSLWNGMMIVDDVLYCCSTGCKIRTSKIPAYDEVKAVANAASYDVRNGGLEVIDEHHFMTSGSQSLVILHDSDLSASNHISTRVIPNNGGDAGIVFAGSDLKDSYWEDADCGGYYIFLINADGYLILGKIVNGQWSEIVSPGSEIIRKGFSRYATYQLDVDFNPSSGEIVCKANNKVAFTATDATLSGIKAGFRSAAAGTVFTPLVALE